MSMGKVSESSYGSMLVQWSKANLREARTDIEPFLHSKDVFLRKRALHALAHFRLQDYWSTAVQFSLYDPEVIARLEGEDALSWLKSDTHDQRTLAVLASIVCDPYDDEGVRENAYRNMLTVAYGVFKGQDIWDKQHNSLKIDFNLEKDADWDFIRACIDPHLEEEWRGEARQLLKDYVAGKVAEQEYYTLLIKFGRARLQEARDVVESFLHSSHPLLRKTALRILVLYLQVSGNWQMAVDVLLHDPDITCRIAAIEVLGLLMRNTRHKPTLLLLNQFFLDEDLSMDAIPAMETIYGGSYGEVEQFLAMPD